MASVGLDQALVERRCVQHHPSGAEIVCGTKEPCPGADLVAIVECSLGYGQHPFGQGGPFQVPAFRAAAVDLRCGAQALADVRPAGRGRSEGAQQLGVQKLVFEGNMHNSVPSTVIYYYASLKVRRLKD